MKLILAAAALVLLAVFPARAAGPAFSLVMVKNCEPGDVQQSYDLTGVSLPVCVAAAPFLTGADIAAARAVLLPQAPPDLANPHVLHLTLTDAAARRLADLSQDNRDESFATIVDDRIISITSIGDPFRGAELELLVSLDDPAFAALLKQLDKTQ